MKFNKIWQIKVQFFKLRIINIRNYRKKYRKKEEEKIKKENKLENLRNLKRTQIIIRNYIKK